MENFHLIYTDLPEIRIGDAKSSDDMDGQVELTKHGEGVNEGQ